ncbi:MAG: SPOR domain-containing protein [Candidimonas sp.]
MGLFSRTESDSGSGRRSASRPSLSSEAQANELRGRARRRLIGALALVLAAVIVLPMLFDSPTPPEQVETPVVVPAIEPPGIQLADNTSLGDAASQGAQEPEPASSPDEATPVAPDPASGGIVGAPGESGAQPPEEQAPRQPAAPAPEPATETPRPAPKPTPSPKPAERTDDGAVALALLEGREPPKPAPAQTAAKGNFTLQIAAYTSDQDAQSRRQRLVSAGVTNAYVETATANGKTAYRLRVGPFPTREAAQAAQARLRALGYDNGFISSR